MRFFLISWLFINQSGHICQIEAEYLKLLNGVNYTVVGKGVQSFFLKWIAHLIFNINYSIFFVAIIDMLMEGTVSQLFQLGPSLCFMWLQRLCLLIIENVSRF